MVLEIVWEMVWEMVWENGRAFILNGLKNGRKFILNGLIYGLGNGLKLKLGLRNRRI